MNAIESPVRSLPVARRHRKRPKQRKRALAWTAGIVFVSAVVLSLLFLSVIAMFDDGVAAQLAATRSASMQLAPTYPGAAGPDDDFYMQKRDAKIEELPPQF